MVLLHVDSEPVQDVIVGRIYSVLPNEPTEVPDHIGELLLRHKHFHGLVKVESRRDKAGIHYDLDAATREAQAALEREEQKAVKRYVRTQVEDRLRKNFPALPPEGRVAAIIERRGIDLRAYGIVPVGVPVTPQTPTAAREIEALRAENRELRSELAEIKDLLRGIRPAPAPPGPPAAVRGPEPGRPIRQL